MANGLVINARSLNRRISGVERYTTELAGRFGNRFRQVRPGKRVPAAAGHFWEQVVLPTRIRKGELLWSPANIGPLSVSDQVLTLHDTSIYEHPEWFRPLYARWYRAILPSLVRRVRQVLTVSEYSRQRILQCFDISPDKVIAIPAGVDLKHFHPAIESEVNRITTRYNLARDYLLFVGTLEPRKNLSRLLEAWQLVYSELPHVELAIAGGAASHFASPLSLKGHPGVRILGYVPDHDLPSLYSGAKAFLLPSLEEGFGLTALEAMACGTPVIASNGGALPAMVGTAGILVDPRDTHGWADAIYCLLTDPARRQECSRSGLAWSRQFSWQTTAERVWQILDSTSYTLLTMNHNGH